MATLLPLAVTQFNDANGNPLAGGSVTFYVPNTTTPKDTWQDSGATILNTNPITLNSAGEAIIYGSGIYRQIVQDIDGNLIWDELTADTAVGGVAWGGISTGSANAQIIAPSSFSSQDGQQITFIAGITNTGQLTVNGIAVLADTGDGPAPLTGGEVVEGNAVSLLYDAPRGAFHLLNKPQVFVEIDPWETQPIGIPIPVFDQVAGLAPPTDQAYRYIKLTAASSYNTGLLTSESVSGAAPLVQATAVVSDPTSPLNGATVHLVNTESRFLRAGIPAGNVQNDQMQAITGSISSIRGADPITANGVFTVSATTVGYAGAATGGQASLGFNSADSANARAGTETRSKNITVTYYMRIH